MSRRRRGALVAAGAVGLVILVGFIVASRGSLAIDGPRVLGPRRPPAPAWTRPCWVLHPGQLADAPFSVRCARVRGTVIFTQGSDPDGDGDRHLVVLAGFHVVVLKYRRDIPGGLPGVGHVVTAVGSVASHQPFARTVVDVLSRAH